MIMKLQHVAFWTSDIARATEFYSKHFRGKKLFSHQDGDFTSTFLSIAGCVRNELMHKPDLGLAEFGDRVGYSHISIDVGSRSEVDRLTDYFLGHGIRLEKERVQYEDGYYESSIFDPDGNIIELAYVDENANPNAQKM